MTRNNKEMLFLAGFFGFFDYEKAGVGISKNQPKKKRPVVFFEILGRKFWKMIQLNLIYLLFCVPIVTIGPATSALVFILREFTMEHPVFLFSDFFEAFKKNFKQSIVMELIDVVFIALMWVAIPTYKSMAESGSPVWYVPLVLCVSITVMFVLMHFYIHLMIVTVDLKLTAILKNAFFLSFLGAKTNLLTLLWVVLLGLFHFLFFPYTILLMPFISFSFLSYVVCFNSFQFIQKYIIDPYYASSAEPDEAVAEPVGEEEVLFQDMGGKELPIKSKKSVPKGRKIR